MVTTTETTAPSPSRIGVTLTSVVTLPPSGTDSSTSSARAVSALLSAWASGNSLSASSRPSAKRHVSAPSNCSTEPSGASSPLTIRLASRLIFNRLPVAASRMTTPTGVVSTSASRSAWARCSAR